MPVKPIRKIDEGVLIDALSGSPAVQAHLAAHAKEIAARRKELVLEREKLLSDAAIAYSTDHAAIDAAKLARDAAQVELIQAQHALNSAVGKRILNSFAIERKEGELVRELAETASTAIGAFVERMWDQLDKALKALPELDVTASKNLVTGRREVITRSARVVQPKERSAAIRAAIAAAEAMKLDAAQDDVPARLAAIEAALPLIGAPK